MQFAGQAAAQKTAYALFIPVLVALQNMDAAIAWLYGGRRVGKTFGSSFANMVRNVTLKPL